VYRCFKALIISIVLLLTSLAAYGGVAEPDIVPEPELPETFKHLSPRDFRAVDPLDQEPELVSAELTDSEGQIVEGLQATWGARCPDGFVANTDGMCRKTEIAPKQDACPDGSEIIVDASQEYCRIEEQSELIVQCPAGSFLREDGSRCDKGRSEAATLTCPSGWELNEERTECYHPNQESVSPAYKCEEGEVLYKEECWVKDKETKSATAYCQAGYSLPSCTKTRIIFPAPVCPREYSFRSNGSSNYRNSECVANDGSGRTTTPQFVCTSDMFLNSNNMCQGSTEYGNKYYRCGSGWNQNGTTCWRYVSYNTVESCPSPSNEWTREGGTCSRVSITDPIWVCPQGYKDMGLECWKTEEVSADQSNLLSVMFPKVWPGSYTLDLAVQNDSGEVTKRSFPIVYQPETFGLRGSEGQLKIPAVQYPFKWPDGSDTLVTETIVLEDGPLTDSQPVFVGVKETAESGFNVSGVEILPGEFKEVHSSYDFNGSRGVLEMSLYPLSSEASTSDLIISIGDTNEHASLVRVDAWVFNGSVQPTQSSPVQIFDEYQIDAERGTETPCRLTGQEDVAKQKSVLSDPYCLIEWNAIPDGMFENKKPPRIVGRTNYDGEEEVSFNAFLVSDDGAKHLVGSAKASVNVRKAFGAFEFAFSNSLEGLTHTIMELNTGLEQIRGPTCSLTVQEDLAIEYAQNGYVGHLCYVEWYNMPGTVDQAPDISVPYLRGRVFSAGAHEIGVKVYAYTSLGVPVLIADQQLAFEAVDPPKPTVEFVDGKEITEGLYEAYLDDRRVASALIKGKNADMEVVHTANGIVEDERVFEATSWRRDFRTFQRIEGVATELWSRDAHEVSARYVDLPAVMATASVETLTVPGEEIGPILYSDADYVLNDDLVAVSVHIGNIYQTDLPYDPLTMGEWEVRIVQQVNYDSYVPLTEWKDHDAEGRVNLDVDIGSIGIKEGFARLYAEARVKSPVPEYSRVEHSTRPVFLTILYGGEIDADIDGRRISGPVPFRGVFRLDLSDRGLFRAIGEVVWKLSTDGGETWVEKDNNARNMQYFDITLSEPGTYMLKAELRNRNSGVAKETAPIEVIAYRKPEVSVEWLSDVFIGEEVTLDATVLMNGMEVIADDVDIEWSNDGGETFIAGGLQHVFERTSDPEEPRRERWAVRVKAPIAPEDDPLAWTIEDGSISFRGIRGPRLYIQGPRVVEVGKAYEFNIYKGLPYSRMKYEIEGYFTLPDGTEVPGDSVVYTPTDEDLETRYINLTYTGWIKGWKEKGAINTDDHSLRVWEYKFPEFIIYGRYSANVAPVEAILYARPIGLSGRLEEPEYTWDLPEGVQVVEDTNPIARKVIIPEPGLYEFSVKVTDRRGNEGGVTEVVDIGTPEPYKLSMRIVGSNDYSRAPYEVLARPDIDGGHPRDQVLEYNYSVDGVPIERVGRYGQTVLDEGDHTIRLDIVSEFGFTAATEETITVYKNKPPVCELDVHEGTYRFTVRNVCDDPDGYVRDYDWWLDGEPLVLSGYRISIPKQETGKQWVVESQATDDSGLTSEVIQSVITMPKPGPEPVEGEEEPTSEETP